MNLFGATFAAATGLPVTCVSDDGVSAKAHLVVDDYYEGCSYVTATLAMPATSNATTELTTGGGTSRNVKDFLESQFETDTMTLRLFDGAVQNGLLVQSHTLKLTKRLSPAYRLTGELMHGTDRPIAMTCRVES